MVTTAVPETEQRNLELRVKGRMVALVHGQYGTGSENVTRGLRKELPSSITRSEAGDIKESVGGSQLGSGISALC